MTDWILSIPKDQEPSDSLFTFLLQDAPSGVRSVLESLRTGRSTEADLRAAVTATGDPSDLLFYYYYLDSLMVCGIVRFSVEEGGEIVCTLIPSAERFRFRDLRLQPDTVLALSRFAYCRVEAGRLLATSPLGSATTVLCGWKPSALLGGLAAPTRYASLVAQFHSFLAEETLHALLVLLINAGVVNVVEGECAELAENRLPLRYWQFHDLLFHSQSRLGRCQGRSGGTHRFLGIVESPPVFKSMPERNWIPLDRPDLTTLRLSDAPFTEVLEARRSVRNYASTPMDLAQLGEFLYRVARSREVRSASPANGAHPEVSSRPYPSAGATYPLELYLSIHLCTGLERGLYYYHPGTHRLCQLTEWDKRVENLLDSARTCAGQSSMPDILVTITARFGRVMWKYENIAYALLLKDVGVLYQTMGLVATAMGLGGCGLGMGNPDHFSDATGIDYYEETSVGEFMLGRTPTQEENTPISRHIVREAED